MHSNEAPAQNQTSSLLGGGSGGGDLMYNTEELQSFELEFDQTTAQLKKSIMVFSFSFFFLKHSRRKKLILS